MSVIPLVRWGSHPTVVAEKDQFRPDRDSLFILNIDEHQLEGNKSNVSYDLRVGRAYRDHRDPENAVRTLPENDDAEITLLPGGAVLVETLEQVWLPSSMFGYVVPKVSLLQDGVSNTLSKVDPGYSDHLVVTVFNLGKKEISLKRGQRFCALVIHDVGAGAIPYSGAGKRIEGGPATGAYPRFFDRIEARNGLIAIMLGLIGLAIVVTELLVHSWMYNHPHQPPQSYAPAKQQIQEHSSANSRP